MEIIYILDTYACLRDDDGNVRTIGRNHPNWEIVKALPGFQEDIFGNDMNDWKQE